MARRATFINDVLEEGGPTLMLDAGDMLGNRNKKEMIQTEFLVEQTATFGYDAIGLGERDLNYGWEWLSEKIEEYHLPYISSNVRDADSGELLLPEYKIVERGGIKFGICSVMDPTYKIISMSARDREYQVDDPIATMRALVPRLRERCDTVVLLSHLGDQPTQGLLKEVEGIDLVLLGHTFKSFNRERIVEDVVMLSAVYDGRTIGRADLYVRPSDGVVMSVQVKVTSLDDAIEDDPTMLAAVDNFKKEAEDRRLAQRAEYPRDLGTHDEMFLGGNNCKACHTTIYQDWRQSDHSRAYTVLRAKSMQFEPECLACHTTGYRHQNGYDEQTRTSLGNVQCEACHGYGTAHQRDGEMLEMARESCTQCHDEDERPCFDDSKDARFEYATYWDKIAH